MMMVSIDPTAGGAVVEAWESQPVCDEVGVESRHVTKWFEWETRNGRPWVATAAVLAMTVFLLRLQGAAVDRRR